MEGRQERAEPLDRAHDLSSLGGEVEAVARGDRSMQQCPHRSRPTLRTLQGPEPPLLRGPTREGTGDRAAQRWQLPTIRLGMRLQDLGGTNLAPRLSSRA